MKPTRADADGLLDRLGEALSRRSFRDIFSTDCVLNVDDGIPVLVGAGTDGASDDVGAHGGMTWCFAHRLELALVPSSNQELTCIVADLKEFFSLPKWGALPVRCHGTR